MKKFKVHMMYKDCKAVEAKTMEEHNKLKKKGYSHKKSKACKTKKDGGASFKDPDIKAAKKQIRKGANVLGGGNIIDDFGSKHGYHSEKTSELDNSRLVQRKKRQYRKDEAKSNIKRYKTKEAKQGFKNDSFFEGEGNKIRKQEIKDIRQTAKTRNKKSKKYAKANRIAAKARKM